MKKMLTAALVCCCLYANANSEPPEAMGNAVAKHPHSATQGMAKPKDSEDGPSSAPKPDDLRVQQANTIEQKEANAEHQKATNEHRHTKKEAQDSWGVTEWSAFASAFGSLIAGFMAIALSILGFYSWKTSKAAVDIASKSLETAKELAAKQTRAYVYITKVDMQYAVLEKDGFNPVSVSLQNYGHTPAHINAFQFTVVEGAQRRESFADDSSTHIILGQGESVTITARFRITNSTDIEAGHTPLQLVFRAVYQDMDGATHHVQEPFMFGDYSNKYGFAPYEGNEERSRS